MPSLSVEHLVEPTVEEAEILATIEAETLAFLNQNVDALCDCWVQAHYIRHATILPYSGVVEVQGIEGLRAHFSAHFSSDLSQDGDCLLYTSPSPRDS